MKRIVIAFILLLMAASGFAQIEDEIMQSKAIKIEKGREYLLEKLLDRDYDKVKEIKDYLLGLEDEYYVALKPDELSFVLLLTREFDVLANYLPQVKSYQAENKVLPNYDDLWNKISQRCKVDEHLIRFNLQEANLSAVENDFLTLFLDWSLKPYSELNREQWNLKADKFLANYPDSEYDWFVRHVIRNKEVDANWGWGFGLDLCSGFLTGPLKERDMLIAGLGLSLDVLYKRFFLQLGYDILFAKSKFDQPYSTGVCEAGKRFDIEYFFADFGCSVVNNRRLSISPFVGIGGFCEMYGINANDDKNLTELDKQYLSYQTGLIFDIKGHYEFEDGVIRIKYNCGIVPINGKISTVNVISIGGTGFFRKKHRVY